MLEGVEEAEQLRRFIHYYERYKSHRESLQVSRPPLITNTHPFPPTLPHSLTPFHLPHSLTPFHLPHSLPPPSLTPSLPSSVQLELPFLEKANKKTETLRAEVHRLDSSRRYTVSVDMSFIEEAIRELLAARRILIASYAFGYYVKGKRARRLFENMQVRS